MEEIQSSVNGQIKIKSFFGQKSVWVGGFQQSGPLVEKLWSKALKTLQGLPLLKQGEPLRNVLVLGLGCGSVIRPLLKKFPNCQITGVEINQEMIAAGKKYFGLDQYRNLKIVCEDAKIFLKRNKEIFDLILVDMYSGKEKVLIKEKLTKTGSIIMENCLEKDKNGFWVNNIKVSGHGTSEQKRQ